MGSVATNAFEQDPKDQEVDQHSTAIDISAIEFTRLPDIDLYRREADFAGMVHIKQGRHCAANNWRSQIEALARAFPDVQRTTLALAVFAAYLARVSEEKEANFTLINNLLPAASGFAAVIRMAIEGRESFAGFLERIAVQQTNSLVTGAAARSFNREHTPHLMVTTGNRATETIECDVHLHLDHEGGIELKIASHIEEAFGEVLIERLVAMARSIARERFRPLAFQAVMGAMERETVTNMWNDTSLHYGYNGGLVAMMQQAAERNPDHPALIYRDEEVSFGEFNARVNRLARKLIEEGVTKDRFVCIAMERSIELVVAIWATIKAGGAYVPLNTADPQARIAEIIEDCDPAAILTQPALEEMLGECAGQHTGKNRKVTVVAEGATCNQDQNANNPDVTPEADQLCYMIYTSGSTGKPKGVTVEHEAIHNRVVWMHEEYGLLPEDRILQKTPYTFDVSVWEFLWSFAVGSTLVVAEPGGHVAMRYLHQLIEETNVTHLHFVPSVLRLFLMLPDLSALPIKKLFCSGEALGFDSVETFYAKANDHAEVHNLYGPTEAAVDVSYYHCPRNPTDTTIPIGKPVTNTGLYVLDENDQPLPVGVPGELHIGGIQLARGYWAREDLTKERFVVPGLLDGIEHKRLYRTGDLAYFRRDGEIVYLGRNDFQVKINGVRMELGEIEAVIRSDETTKDVVVVAEEQGGNKVLVAYVVSTDPDTEGRQEKAEHLKALIAETRPPYYVPRDIVFLKQMPLTTSGKINRKQLKQAKTV